MLPLCVVLLLGLLACGDDTRISVSTELTPPVSPAMLTVTVSDGSRRITWNGDDFHPRPDNSTPTTGEASLQATGPDIVVAFRLVDSGVLLSQGSITLPRRSDWRWGVTIFNKTTDPRQGCFGCMGAAAFDLAASHRVADHDSTWIVWGGNSISNPAIY